MNNIKELDKAKLALNAYRLILDSQFTFEQVASSLNISEREIYYWGEGKRFPNLRHVYVLSQLFNVQIESILV